jgi:hypothetical protein
MSIFYGVLAVVSGIGGFVFADPAGVPVFGLAFAAAGFMRESRGSRRAGVFALLGVGSLICVVGLLRSFHVF